MLGDDQAIKDITKTDSCRYCGKEIFLWFDLDNKETYWATGGNTSFCREQVHPRLWFHIGVTEANHELYREILSGATGLPDIPDISAN